MTLKSPTTSVFAIPSNYVGTSMAAAHVSAAAGWSSPPTPTAAPASPRKLAGAQPRVNGVAKRLRETARDLYLSTAQQGAGLIDIGHATEPRTGSPSS